MTDKNAVRECFGKVDPLFSNTYQGPAMLTSTVLITKDTMMSKTRHGPCPYWCLQYKKKIDI